MIYLACRDNEGCVHKAICENWQCMNNELELAEELFDIVDVYVTCSEHEHKKKVSDWVLS